MKHTSEKDLELLERLQLGDDNEDEIPPLEQTQHTLARSASPCTSTHGHPSFAM